MAKGKVVKKKKNTASDRKQVNMKLVLSGTCDVCKTPCNRGIRYREMMKEPGALGKGVPCILTRTFS
ncbi:hypothetical protein Back11_25090 [Paenibacillus baekrokdamisoli]|uniref:Uncharacterized protein n=1 Tax=Paenibacillus baekrokdamisoli TaxID=1712516 RepID=A0A3G9JDC2_9BACL|nr:hypothetical protein [Paenibacillus baekrokdamisoli]MBB3070154.1 hypothetical protein [Paenibacillus baekrokdamisoli]BBH21164.1 hypothetical protein Back11_25090 [Paenibacillus baekrokdamisoli]